MKNKPDLKELQDFIREKCGGDSLAHILKGLSNLRNAICIYDGWLNIKIDAFKDLHWFLIVEGKEAKLQDQTSETQLVIAQLLGWSEK